MLHDGVTMSNSRRSAVFSAPTPIIGRADAIGRVAELLARDDVRLVTLTGEPGIGKTALAVQVAASAAARVDAVHFVSLATSIDPNLVAASIAHALGVPDAGPADVVERIAWAIEGQLVLLVLDTFEHVLPAAALVAELLAVCPGLTTLVTSRAALRVRGEHEFPVPPLALPDLDARPAAGGDGALGDVDLAAIEASPAVQLFVQRAQAVRPGFALVESNAGAVAAICRSLDGLPLAIELAAARSRLFAPQALLARMTRRLPLLSDGPRDLPARQRTLYDAIAWSYQLLDAPARQLFARLSAFAGGASLAAVATVAGDHPEAGDAAESALLSAIEQLVEHSLLRPGAGDEGEPRVAMLETIREFAAERLEVSGEASAIHLRHARYCLALATRAAPELRDALQASWLQRLDLENDNLRAALAWCLGAHRQPPEAGEVGLRLSGVLWWYWTQRGRYAEGRRWVEQLVERYPDAPPDARCGALLAAGKLAEYQGDSACAEVLLSSALSLAGSIGDPLRVADAQLYLARVDRDRGEYERAVQRAQASLAAFQQCGSPEDLIWAHLSLGDAWLDQGHADEAAPHYEWALEASRRHSVPDCVASSLFNLGTVAALRGDAEHASQLYEAGRAQFEALRVGGCVGEVRLHQGRLALTRGELRQAEQHFRSGLAELRELGWRHLIALGLEGLAAVASARNQAEQAAQLFGCAAATRRQVGAAPRPIDRSWRDRALSAARAQLARETWAAAWAAGEASDPDELLKNLAAPSHPAALKPRPLPPDEPVRLTPRERQVIGLIAHGYSNRAIANELVITERTAEIHVGNILGKLGLSSRAHAAAYAVSHGLVTPETLGG
jgi:predicted ATPase/DNA-binding CsgD family transcriptional regulator